jgi:Bardet-Biedl syndrome 4 protein
MRNNNNDTNNTNNNHINNNSNNQQQFSCKHTQHSFNSFFLSFLLCMLMILSCIALIRRQTGEIAESLVLFQQASSLNPGSVTNLKQVGRSLYVYFLCFTTVSSVLPLISYLLPQLNINSFVSFSFLTSLISYLLGKHKEALSILESAEKNSSEDWEIWHNKGLCLMHVKEYGKFINLLVSLFINLHFLTERAAECIKKANAISKHDSTYLLLGRLFALQENYKAAIDTLLEALEYVEAVQWFSYWSLT